jgi:hypothetical protein
MKINNILLSKGLDAEAIELTFDSHKLLDYIKYALPKGLVHFQYIKADGTHRFAFGTTKPELIPSKLVSKADSMFEMLRDVVTAEDINSDVATRITELMDEIKAGHKPAKDHGANTIIYYDFEARGFRSFTPENLLAIY